MFYMVMNLFMLLFISFKLFLLALPQLNWTTALSEVYSQRQYSFYCSCLFFQKNANKKIICVRLTNCHNHLKNNLQFYIQNLNCSIVGTHCSIFGTPYTCSFCVKYWYFKDTMFVLEHLCFPTHSMVIIYLAILFSKLGKLIVYLFWLSMYFVLICVPWK